MQLKRRIDAAIRALEINPYLGKALKGELLGKRSLRIGDYRAIYTKMSYKKLLYYITLGIEK